jgi:hypothetical protein
MSEAERAEIRAYMQKVNNLPYRYKGRVTDNSSHFTSARITVVKSSTDGTTATTTASAAAANTDVRDNAADSKVRFLDTVTWPSHRVYYCIADAVSTGLVYVQSVYNLRVFIVRRHCVTLLVL